MVDEEGAAEAEEVEEDLEDEAPETEATEEEEESCLRSICWWSLTRAKTSSS